MVILRVLLFRVHIISKPQGKNNFPGDYSSLPETASSRPGLFQIYAPLHQELLVKITIHTGAVFLSKLTLHIPLQ
jgi:hypothetical protein